MAQNRLDVDFVRAQFPAFADPRTGRWAHLENAGGSYVPRQVIDLLTGFYVETKVQPGHPSEPAQRAAAAMDRARVLLPALFNAAADEVMLGPSTTQNGYVLAHALRPMWSPGDEIVVTNQDHEANIGAWRRLAETGITVREWTVDPATGLLDPAGLEPLLSDRTRLVAVTHASNIAAAVHPVRAMADRVHAAGGLLVVDGVSYAPHAAVDVRALDCDVYLFSTYKTYGPHQGAMYVRQDLLARIPNQGHFFNADRPTYRLTPAGPDHASVAATAGIVDYYRAVYEHHVGPADDVDPVQVVRGAFELFGAQEQEVMAPLGEFLVAREGVRLIGEPSTDHTRRAPTFSFTTRRRSAAEVGRALADAGVGCGVGHFYAYRLLRAVGVDPAEGVVRLSLVHYNTRAEVDRALEVLDVVL